MLNGAIEVTFRTRAHGELYTSKLLIPKDTIRSGFMPLDEVDALQGYLDFKKTVKELENDIQDKAKNV